MKTFKVWNWARLRFELFLWRHFYTPAVTQINGQHELLSVYDELSVYTGDYFTAPIQPVDIIYDRASLVALPAEMRVQYVERLKQLWSGGKILLVTLDYDQDEMAGPPFSVPKLNRSVVCRLQDYVIESRHCQTKSTLRLLRRFVSIQWGSVLDWVGSLSSVAFER